MGNTDEELAERLQSLKVQQQEANRRVAQAEAKQDAVQAKKAEVMESLKNQGFDSPEAARERVESLGKEVDAVLQDIEEKVSGL